MMNMLSLATILATSVAFGLASVKYGEDSRRDERNW